MGLLTSSARVITLRDGVVGIASKGARYIKLP
jgi:hypothetical protein